jgi:ArsR family transcriptional regulator, arsenate/arsenite/antimonite-responsive transcriptional repressor
MNEAARYADMFAALGNEQRLEIVRRLLAAHPEGLVVGEIQRELGMAASTLSHHLDRLKQEGLIEAKRQGVFLRQRVRTEALRELLGFLYAECCTRNQAVRPEDVVACC